MKNFFSVLLVGGVLYLSSCGNGANPPLPVISPADSSSTGSYLTTWFLGNDFVIHDLSLNGIAYIQLSASDMLNNADTTWICRIQLIDPPKNQMEINVTAVGTSPTGSFTVVNNNSTLTDYTNEQNITYGIAVGSVVTITNSSYPIKGSMNLTLNYNFKTVYASDSFSINQ